MGVKYVPRHKTLRIFMNFDRNNAIMEKITDNDYQSFSQSCFYLRWWWKKSRTTEEI